MKSPVPFITCLTLACGGAAIAGHCYPVWFNFAGGKGAATTLGVLIAIAPALILLRDFMLPVKPSWA